MTLQHQLNSALRNRLHSGAQAGRIIGLSSGIISKATRGLGISDDSRQAIERYLEMAFFVYPDWVHDDAQLASRIREKCKRDGILLHHLDVINRETILNLENRESGMYRRTRKRIADWLLGRKWKPTTYTETERDESWPCEFPLTFEGVRYRRAPVEPDECGVGGCQWYEECRAWVMANPRNAAYCEGPVRDRLEKWLARTSAD